MKRYFLNKWLRDLVSALVEQIFKNLCTRIYKSLISHFNAFWFRSLIENIHWLAHFVHYNYLVSNGPFNHSVKLNVSRLKNSLSRLMKHIVIQSDSKPNPNLYILVFSFTICKDLNFYQINKNNATRIRVAVNHLSKPSNSTFSIVCYLILHRVVFQEVFRFIYFTDTRASFWRSYS